MKSALLIGLLFFSLLSTSEASKHQSSLKQIDQCSQSCQKKVKQLIRYAFNGSPQAQTTLALAYQSGELVEKDDSQAWKWIKRARNQGYSPALHIVSQWYRRGYNTQINHDKANYYLARAAKKADYSPAVLDLGLLHYKNSDDKKAIPLIQSAAKMGHPRARYLLKLISGDPEKTSKELEKNLIIVNNHNQQTTEKKVTIVANKESPMQLFNNLLANIKDQAIYERKGMTGQRTGDRKCGHSSPGCNTLTNDAIRETIGLW